MYKIYVQKKDIYIFIYLLKVFTQILLDHFWKIDRSGKSQVVFLKKASP